MAQLPPKIPNMAPNWPEFSSHKKLPSLKSISPNGVTNTNIISNHHPQNPSWVDEFLDFSAVRRGAHRRSVSDSITFLESPVLVGHHCKGGGGNSGDNEFDRFDDEQFMSMFSDEASGNAMVPQTLSTSNPSTPSDHNSINEEEEQEEKQEKKRVKNESDEDEIQCKQEITEALNNNDDSNDNSNHANTCSSDRITDPKRVKRILANRQSAQRSRVRKLQYISELERSVTTLQAEVSVLSPRVAFLDHQRLLLNVDNSALKQRIAALAQDKIFKDAHQEALKREIERLRQVYHQQNIKKQMDNNAAGSPSQTPSPSPEPRWDTQTEKEQLIINV
ncbi:hypothetical protein RJT34_31311 [Clitoria ternatea]|uniref:BZIP domain-containing protein n=1 Tax=Clitoria ternatea TaxID=43366 RepID=A0AAN9EU29_CLITE